MICKECKPGALCEHCVTTVAPKDCSPCRWCGKADKMYAEIPVNGDWHGQGFVLRIGCLCDRALEEDDWRTDFWPYQQAVADWNLLQAGE